MILKYFLNFFGLFANWHYFNRACFQLDICNSVFAPGIFLVSWCRILCRIFLRKCLFPNWIWGSVASIVLDQKISPISPYSVTIRCNDLLVMVKLLLVITFCLTVLLDFHGTCVTRICHMVLHGYCAFVHFFGSLMVGLVSILFVVTHLLLR